MEHIYPVFEYGRIMKKELLESLREYSYSAMDIKYQDYSDGIITGCNLDVEGDFIIISPGIIKCAGFLFMLSKEERIRYQAYDKFVSLKFRIVKRDELPDFLRYITEYVLDEELKLKTGEIEIARFNLKQGSQLRCKYKDFQDIQTEFDTLNLLDSTWAGRGSETIPVPILRYFAEEIMKRDGIVELDRCFAWQCLDRREGLDISIIQNYVRFRIGKKISTSEEKSNIYHMLCQILNQAGEGKGDRGREYDKGRRMIIVD